MNTGHFEVRVIPCLLLRGAGLYKTVKFKDPKYVGDPINVVRIFNEKEVDELIFLDITATVEKRAPNVQMLRKIVGECFMPLAYGGGICDLIQVEEILRTGVEKVVFNAALFEKPEVVKQAAKTHGSSTIVASIDFKYGHGRREVVSRSASRGTEMVLREAALRAEDLGVGEILVNSVERDGTMRGYDVEALREVADAVKVPVIACGGAGSLDHFREAIQAGRASAVAAGSFFVFWGRRRAVLITYPTRENLQAAVTTTT
jgi:imidazole glycerol-phosphate synthase subunit HisF